MTRRVVAGLILVLAILSIPLALSLQRPQERAATQRIGPKVAVLHLVGAIADATDPSLPQSMGGMRKLLDDLAEVRKDPQYVAVVLRINSGGGSAAASQEIHRALSKVREAGKPVVVSMGDIAASGAFYAAVAADEIFANPSTITGSIGVLAQYLDASELADRYGVKIETIKTGAFKDIGNPTESLTDEQRALIQSVVDDSLDQFVAAVAEGRGLDEGFVRGVADGRILTGNQALELGLIDAFGGLEEAIARAWELAGQEGEPRVARFEERRPWFARYLGFLAGEPSLGELDLLRRLLGEERGVRLRY